MSPGIEFRRVTKIFPRTRHPVLEGVDLAVTQGEILALVGESGSGKTTLLRLAAGLERPTAGEIRVSGLAMAGAGVWVPPERRKIGFVCQEGALFPHRTVAGNIRYGLSGRPRREQDATVEEMLALVGLVDHGERYPHELSGGERQRVALARALAAGPHVMLLDEPFSNLDVALRHALRDEVVRILAAAGATALLVVHDPEDALSAGDRIAVLRAGRVEQVASPRHLYDHPCSEYAARLFGPSNAVAAADGTTAWVRPEQFRVVAGPVDDAVPARVLSVNETGSRTEITVHARRGARSEWLLRGRDLPRVSAGDELWVVVHATPRPPAG